MGGGALRGTVGKDLELTQTMAYAFLVALLFVALSGASAVRLGGAAPASARPAFARCRAVLMKDELPTMAVGLDLLSEVQQMVAAEPVVIYSKSWCPYCTKCKALFDDLGQRYTAVELDEREDGEQLQATLLSLTQQRTVPNVFVGGQHLGGNDDTQAAARSGRLAQLLASPTGLTGRVVPTKFPAAASPPAAVSPDGETASDDPVAKAQEALADPVRAVFQTLYAPGQQRKIAWGVFQQPVDPSTVPSDEARLRQTYARTSPPPPLLPPTRPCATQERARRRATAAEQLVNIDAEERERRKTAGLAMGAVTGVLGAALLGWHAPAAARLAISPPLFLSVGYAAYLPTTHRPPPALQPSLHLCLLPSADHPPLQRRSPSPPSPHRHLHHLTDTSITSQVPRLVARGPMKHRAGGRVGRRRLGRAPLAAAPPPAPHSLLHRTSRASSAPTTTAASCTAY